MDNDKLILGGHEFNSRFILGSGKYSLDLIKAAVENAGAEIITLALRRAVTGKVANILDYIPKNVTLLPNTSGARNADEAVRIARLAREAGCGDFIKIEVIRDSKYLLPDNYETIKATEALAKEGFIVLPYMYPDLNVARSLRDAGAAAIMPLGSPIGSNKGIATKEFIKIIINEIDLPVIVDAGIGRPSQACEAMEMGAYKLTGHIRSFLQLLCRVYQNQSAPYRADISYGQFFLPLFTPQLSRNPVRGDDADAPFSITLPRPER